MKSPGSRRRPTPRRRTVPPKAEADVRGPAPAATPPPAGRRVGVYLYGILRWPAPGDLASLGARIGDPPPPPGPIPHRGIAALLSGVLEPEVAPPDVRGTRRASHAH